MSLFTEKRVADTLIECAEVTGKTVHRLRLATSDSGGQELHLEFTDGTAFSLTVEPSTVLKAALIRQSEGREIALRTYAE